MSGTPHQDDGDPLVGLTGDPDAARLLRDNLGAIAEQHRDAPLGRLVAQVLDGRRPVRDLENDPDFLALTRSGVDRYRSYLAALTPDERARLLRSADDLAD